ncbi:hypothetical protein [Chitinibacter tainanensis]|uniref:hypothetical protein n=1 Tax=Chitinibacter tainanensis TaxID=230667 RepID=UPI0023530299|nr:hypothetical protein [Chitinibacter tainanensis]
MSNKKWIGVDLDGTLAESVYGGLAARQIGNPIASMLTRVKKWVDDGKYEVRIFTGRAADSQQIPLIQRWLDDNGIGGLKITNAKDGDLVLIFDNIAIRIDENTGKICEDCIKFLNKQKFKYVSTERNQVMSYVADSAGVQYNAQGYITADC